MPTISPGWTTTEFWSVVVAQIFAALELFHIVVPNQGPLITAVAVIGAAIASAVYAHGRSRIKAAQQMTSPTLNLTTSAGTPAPATMTVARGGTAPVPTATTPAT